MPQITLETTSNLPRVNTRKFFSELHQLLADNSDIDIEACKSRSIVQDDFYIGADNINKAFVHLDILILDGRDQATKVTLGEKSLELLKSYYSGIPSHISTQFTVRVDEVSRKIYFKVVI